MQAAEKKAFVGLMGAFSSLTAYGAFWQYRKYQNSSSRWNKAFESVSKFEPYEIQGKDTKFYPWYRDADINNWEYRLVKLKGYFKEERFFVRREKDGKDGFLVFAPFVTAIHHIDPDKKNDANPSVESSIFVNLGWVPKESQKDIAKSSEPVPYLDAPENNDLSEIDSETGFLLDQGHMDEDRVVSIQEIVGIVRPTETEALFGKKNFPFDGVFNYVDLDYWAKFFRIWNRDACATAYIERIVPEPDDDTVFPVPSTKDDFKPLINPASYLQNGTLLGGASLIGLASVVLYSLK